MIIRCIKCGEDWSIREEKGNYVCPECRKNEPKFEPAGPDIGDGPDHDSGCKEER